MITILNRLRQPLVLNVGENQSLHLLSRERVEVTNEQLNSSELKSAINRGDVIVLKIE